MVSLPAQFREVQDPEQLASERTVAGLDVEPQGHGYPVNSILDGQQRL